MRSDRGNPQGRMGWTAAEAAVFLFLYFSFASSSNACVEQVEARIQVETERQHSWYQAHGGIVPSEQSRSVFLRGTNGRAAIVFHGFTASPADMSEISTLLNGVGYTVYAPLITGFGAGPTAANASRIEDWQTTAMNAIQTMGACFSDVVLIGHSLGGALALEAAHRQLTQPSASPRVSRLVLLAPYLRTRIPGMNLINDVLKSFGTTMDLRILKLFMKVGPDAGLPLPIPPHFAQDEDFLVPLQAIESALDYQKRFMPSSGLAPHPIPVFVAVSPHDPVIDPAFAQAYVASSFVSPRVFTAGDPADPTSVFEAGTAHFLHHRVFNKRFEEMTQALLLMLN